MIIADTGFFIALFNRRDQFHQLAVNQLNQLTEPIITTHAVIRETYYLIGARGGGQHQQVTFLQDIADQAFCLFDLTSTHFARLSVLLA